MNNKIKVLIGDDSAETGVSTANKLREKGMYAYTRRKDCGEILESIKKDPPTRLCWIYRHRTAISYPL